MSKPLIIPFENFLKKMQWYLQNDTKEGKRFIYIEADGTVKFVTVPEEAKNA